MGEPDGVELLVELLSEVRALRAEQAELRAIVERDTKPEKPPQSKAVPKKPVRVTEADRAAARKLARRIGLVVHEPAKGAR